MPQGPDPVAAGAPDLARLRAAAAAIAPHVLRTPTLPSPALSRLTGAEVVVKHEVLQPTGSFKDRGACHRLLQLPPDARARGVIALSAGNHAQAVAFHARRLGAPAVIVMPLATPHVKAENTRAHGAEVILHGETLADCEELVTRLAQERGLTPVHPYDDEAVIAGQGTAGLELFEDQPDLDAVLVPVGGGGLISGVAAAAQALAPRTAVIGVEALAYPSMRNAVFGETRPVGGATLAEGIAVKTVGQRTLPIVRALVRDVLLVDEPALERAVAAFATHGRVMAEGAGAAGLAALLSHGDRFRGQRVGLILCGANIDGRLLAALIVRELEREGRVVSFRLTALDRPGLLGRLATRLGQLDANILEVTHRRLFLDVPAKGVGIDITIEARDASHADRILAALSAEGYAPRRLDPRGVGTTETGA